MIKAEVHTDDHGEEAEFDATPWFEQASDEEIAALAGCGWGGDFPADGVAEFMATRDKPVEEVFDYLLCLARVAANHRSLVEYSGFECHVEEGSALAWLQEHRPHLLASDGSFKDPAVAWAPRLGWEGNQ